MNWQFPVGYCSVTSATVIANFKLCVDWIKLVTW